MAIVQPCLIFLTIIFLHFVSAQLENGPGSVPVGSSLTATDDVRPWLSPSGDFAFGFQRIQGQNNFVLSIWYDKIPNKTIIWYPQTNATVSQGSKVELIDGRGLILSDPQGRQVWTSESSSSLAYGFMNDTGNFVLVGNNSRNIWESFNIPADTILPTQVLARGGSMSSKISETDYTRGRFQLRLLEEGNLVLNTIDISSGSPGDAYYISDTNDEANSTNSGDQLIFDETGYMYILRRNGERSYLTSRTTLPSGDYYHRATLNSDGIFTQYSYPMNPTGNTSWEIIKFWPENICNNGGACGLNNVCSLQGNRRSCECPQRFSLLDSGDPSGNCNPDFTTPTCNKDYRGDLFDFIELNDIDWPGGDYFSINPANEEICKTSCLEDCSCAVAIFRSNRCWKKKLPLSNGKVDTSLNVKVFMKFRKESKGLTAAMKLIIGFSSGLAGIMLMCILFVIRTRKKKLWQTLGALQVESKFQHMQGDGHGLTRNHQIELFIQNYKSLAPKRFQYSEIKKMTKSFQEKLGQGGYGSVYKGELPGGILVAVKLLNEVTGDGEDFINEVASIGRTSHVNIVTLFGFCFEGNKRALIYEFMPNGSLDRFLRDDDSHLDWNTLFHVSKGIARGLEYLHRDCNTRIVHFDIKPHNVLLDEEFVPKISDFGLAKLCKKKESIVSVMGARGTAGYMAPEVFFKSLGGASHKSDVYSYGMMVLEMTGAHKNNNPNTTSAGEGYFPEWIYKKVDARYHPGVDGVTTEQEEELAKKMVTVSLWCIQSDPSDRPPISKVVEMLEGSLESLQVPPKRIWQSPTRTSLGTSPLATQSSASQSLLTLQAVGEALSS